MTKRLSVLLVVGTAEIGGTELQLVGLAKELTDIGVEVELAFVNAGGPLVEVLRRDGIIVHTFRIGKTHHGPREFFRYRQLLRVGEFSVVHSFLPHSIVISAAAITSSRTRPIFVAGLRNQVGKYRRELRFGLSAALRMANSITVNAPELISEVVDFASVPASVIELLVNGVDIPGRVSTPGVEPATGVVLANFHPYKGHRTLLAALQQCQSPSKFVFFGRGHDEGEIRQEIQSRQLQDFVEIRFEKSPRLDRFQFAVHPSLTEGLPNAVLEEMSYGLPVVASSVGGIPGLLGNNEGGYLCQPGNSGELAKSIDTIASSPGLRQIMGERNRCFVSQFDWTKTAIRYREFYESLAKKSA